MKRWKQIPYVLQKVKKITRKSQVEDRVKRYL